MNKSSLSLLLVLWASLFLAGCSLWEEDESAKASLKIGVMLPFSGEYASEWNTALDWAVENINQSGGVAGCKLELVKKDLAKADLHEVAETFIKDEKIKAVIGPLTSSNTFEVAPLFIEGKKVLLSPVATAANLSRAFAGKKYFWRLVEPDISQTKTLLLLAQSEGAHSVGLITEDSEYGASFENWFGFFATELGLEVSGIEVIDPENIEHCGLAWEALAEKRPDVVVGALNSPAQNLALAKSFRSNGKQIRLLFSDAACLPSLIENMGPLAENLEGTTITSDPSSGFDISYQVRYGRYPDAFLANAYDAVMLLALALEASQGEGGEALAESLMKVVSGDARECSWQRDEILEALRLIKAGVFPNVRGTSGTLDYDQLYFTDVTSSTYGHWRVDAGQFVVTNFYTSDGKGRISSTSAAYRTIARKRQEFSDTGSWPSLLPKAGNYAFLMATSKGWNNYRHQADVLHTYQLLKKNGFDDGHILLILEDDLAWSSSNQFPGVVRNEPVGENLYQNVVVDYKLSEVNSAMIRDILKGNKTDQSPVVLESGKGDNVFMFVSGHGSPGGVALEAEQVELLTPQFWRTLFDEMDQKQNFRQIFWPLEACYSGAIGEAVTTPGIMLMTGSNPYETSKAHFYDSELKCWLADKFAYAINHSISQSTNLTFDQLYEKCYTYVNGSHVSFYNYQNFGNIHEINLQDFVTR